jgi:hypothetical protein
MRRFAIQTLCVVGFLVCIAAVASAQGRPGCQTMTGTWAYTQTGTLLPPTGPVPFAAVGTVDIDRDGAFTGSQYNSIGGLVVKNVTRGSGSLQDDCTIVSTFEVYDESGTLLRTAVMVTVVDDNGRDARGMLTQLTLPNGVVVPQVLTLTARKVHDNVGKKR